MEDNINGGDGSSRQRVCGSGGQSQQLNVYTSQSSTVKLVLHRFVTDDNDDDDVTGYNFLLKYEGRSANSQALIRWFMVFVCIKYRQRNKTRTSATAKKTGRQLGAFVS